MILQIKQSSLRKLLNYGITLAKEKVEAEIIGKPLGNPTDSTGKILKHTIPPLTNPDPEKCNYVEDWSKLNPLEKWKYCPGIPEYLITNRTLENRSMMSTVRRWMKNTSDILNPIPAKIELKNLVLKDLQLGPITLNRVSNETLVRERMTPARKRPVESYLDDQEEEFEKELQERLKQGEKSGDLEYELTIPIRYLQVDSGLQAEGAGFAYGRTLLDVKKMSVILDTRKLPGDPEPPPAEIRLRFSIGKDGQLTQFKILSLQGEKASHLRIPLNSAFLSYEGVNQPIQGDQLSDQKLNPATLERVKNHFASTEDADHFTWLANFLNNNKAAQSMKRLFNSQLESLVEDEIFPIIHGKLEEVIKRYTNSEKEASLDVSTFRVSRQLDAAKAIQRNYELTQIEDQILAHFVNLPIRKGESKEIKELSNEIDVYRTKMKEHLKLDKNRMDSKALEVYQHRLVQYKTIIRSIENCLANSKEVGMIVDKDQAKTLKKSLTHLNELLADLSKLNQELSSAVENQHLKYKVKLLANTLEGLHQFLNVSITDLISPENEGCDPIEEKVSAEVPEGSDGRVHLSITGMNDKLKQLHRMGFFDFCYNHHEIRDCSKHKLIDLAADISFKNPPSIQWDRSRRSHYIDLSQLQIEPKGLANLMGLLIPKALDAQVYLTPRPCTKDGQTSICLDTQIQGQVTSSNRSLIDKMLSQLQLGTEIEPALIGKVISHYAPDLQEEIKKHPIPTSTIEFGTVHQKMNDISFDFKIK
jgi:hypothetical protein